MSRCNNCGRETLRTEDWACQWCGYPLVSGAYRKIEKTYRQLKEERLRRPAEEPAPEPELESEREIEQIEVPEPEEEPAKEEETKKEEEPIREPEECIAEEEPVREAEPEPESDVEPEIKTEEDAAGVAEAVMKIEEEIEAAIEVKKAEEIEAMPEVEIERESEPEPELEPVAEDLNVTELFKAYEEDDVVADERFVNKILRVTGVVSLVDAKNVSDTHYIRLAASEGDLMQSVQCLFDKKNASSLSQLEKGQVVTVQGRYNGSVIAMRIVDCVLIV